MTSDTIDYFMSQPNGAKYVVLYQMLCLKTINTDGKLERKIGEIIIPYDISKIQRDTKWFSEDTIRVALQLYKSFGLIYEDQDGTLVMADHENLVGSETDYAAQKKIQRSLDKPTQALLPPKVDNCADTTVDNVHTDVHTENRDRDKRLEKENRDNSTDSKESVRRPILVRRDSDRIMDAWNSLGFNQVRSLKEGSKRVDSLRARVNEYGVDGVIEAINRIQKSSFLRGQNKSGWTITFEWFVKPNNFIKVIEGQYDDHVGAAAQQSTRYSYDDA